MAKEPKFYTAENPGVKIKSHPITKLLSLLGHDVNELDNNPRIQLRIHTIGFWYWTINFPLITYLYIYWPKQWLSWGLFITLIYSIYANWTSDYTGMSSAQSVINTATVEIIDSNVTVNVDNPI